MSKMRAITVLSTLMIILSTALGHEGDVHTVQYKEDDFSKEIAKKNHFVMFYAPWCGHCQRLAPTWEQLAEMLNEEESNVRIAKVDCTIDGRLCGAQDITGYPTLKFFKQGDLDGVKFRGTRDLPSLTTFINEQLGSESSDDVIKVLEPHNGLVELTEETFDKHITSGKHFVKFYAPWCGHCQKLAPVWEQLAQSLEFQEDISVAKVDCTQHRTVCNLFEIKGYPTLLWIEDGKKVEKYQGPRTHDDLKNYVNKMLGGSSDEQKGEKAVEVKEEATSPVTVLTGDNFQHGIEKGISFIKFFAPWCGHCKRLAPTWEELGKRFSANEDVNIIKIDCTLEVNRQLCNEQEVDGFPSVFLYKDGEKVSEYRGNRSIEDLVDFIHKYYVATVHDEL